MKIDQARQLGRERLSVLTDVNASLETDLLLCHLLGCDRSYLFARAERELEHNTRQQLMQLLQRRAAGEPMAYILGQRAFWTCQLAVSPDTLIPRPETELLVETALQKITKPIARVLELGTGSGAITTALACEKPGWQITATDCSAAAMQVARRNFEEHGITVSTRLGSWFEAVDGDSFDLVICNPPYIPDSDRHLQQGDLRFEPLSALASGIDGLDAIREITRLCPRHLQANGWLMLEHGYDQNTAVQKLFTAAGFAGIQTLPDLAGLPRVTVGQWRA